MGPDQFSFVVDYVPKTGNAVAAPTSNQDQGPESAGSGGFFLHLTSKESNNPAKKGNNHQSFNCATPTFNQDYRPQCVGAFS